MPSAKSISILVVEDNPVICKILQRAAERAEGVRFHVDVASDGLSGYEHAIRRPPDLVILDLMMPAHDGRAFLEKYRGDPRLARTKVVIYSAAPEEQLKAVQFDYPEVKAVLQKPLSPTQLVKALVNLQKE